MNLSKRCTSMKFVRWVVALLLLAVTAHALSAQIGDPPYVHRTHLRQPVKRMPEQPTT